MIMTRLRVLAITMGLTLIIGSLFCNTYASLAKDYQRKSLAVSQANYCGQGDVGMNVQCTNTVSQTQGNENGVAVTD